MPTAVDRRVKKLVAEEKHAARVARTEKAKQLRDRAQRELEAEARAAERAAKKQRADQVEAERRSTRTPYCEFHANGKVVTVMLGGAEPMAAGVAVEAARRTAYQCAHRFQDLAVASRAAGQEPGRVVLGSDHREVWPLLSSVMGLALLRALPGVFLWS